MSLWQSFRAQSSTCFNVLATDSSVSISEQRQRVGEDDVGAAVRSAVSGARAPLSAEHRVQEIMRVWGGRTNYMLYRFGRTYPRSISSLVRALRYILQLHAYCIFFTSLV